MSTVLKDVYASVTNTIIAALEAGTPPWVHPWQSSSGSMLPLNLSSGRHYRGINVLLLSMQAMQCGYSANRWMTYSQARALGAQVRQGEQGTEVVYFKLHEFGAGAVDDAPAGGASERRVIPLIRSFTVFNADQIDGLPEALIPGPVTVHEWQACEAAEAILATSGADIRYGGSRAFYSSSEDRIQLPNRSDFGNAADFSRVALHELTHWSGHPSRCNRVLSGRAHIEAYAMEELVAEMGSAFLTDHCGLPGALQHASYIECWLAALRNDKRLIFTAASQAQKAADFLLAPLALEPVVEQMLEAA
jgi:antirestriction protein ArdC